MTFVRFCNKWAVLACLLVCLPLLAQAQEESQKQAQYQEIIQNLRCMTCPNETIAESASPMALDVKLYVAQHLEMGDTPDKIIDTLTKRYGEALRYKPVIAGHTLVLWFAPVICLLIGGAIVGFMFIRKRKS